MPLFLGFAALVAGRLSDRSGGRALIVAGLAVVTAALAALAVSTPGQAIVLVGLALAGTGLGLASPRPTTPPSWLRLQKTVRAWLAASSTWPGAWAPPSGSP